MCALWARYPLECFVFQSRQPVYTASDNTRVRGSVRASALCQASLRKRKDGHAMDQGLSFEQAHLWPSTVSFFLICRSYFLEPFLKMHISFIVSQWFCLSSFLRYLYGLRQIRTYPHLSVIFHACFVAFELCVFLYT